VRYFFERPLGRGETNPLHPAFGDGLQPLQRKGQVRATLGGHDGVNLIDDHRVHPAQGWRRHLEVSSRYKDSGVVIRISAGCRRKRLRSCCDVSPVRILMSG
jgi:hypothetical protein